jgi:sugar lactone lactonase YvrE
MLPTKIILCLCSVLTLSGMTSDAQTVQKYRTSLLNGPDGITLDKEGNLYIANWGQKSDGKYVVKIDVNGNESVHIDDLAAPDGLTFSKDGTLYISNFASGEIIRILNGRKEVFANGIDHPSDLKFDNKGNLYVSSFGNFNGTKVLKILPDGKITVFADSINVPLGLSFDIFGDLYVSSFGSGDIYKISPSGKKNLFARLPNEKPGYFQYLAFDDSGNLYCPSFGHNCIYRISQNGEVSIFKFSDPMPALAGPNSIFIRGDDLYFTEFTTNSVYKVKLTY